MIMNQSPFHEGRKEREYNYMAFLSSRATSLEQIYPRPKKDRLDNDGYYFLNPSNPGMSEVEMKQIADLMDGKKIPLAYAYSYSKADHYIVKNAS